MGFVINLLHIYTKKAKVLNEIINNKANKNIIHRKYQKNVYVYLRKALFLKKAFNTYLL